MTKCEVCGQLFDPNDNYVCPCQVPRRMSREEYRAEVMRTLGPAEKYPKDKRLTLAALGLAGESGEVVDLIKKHLFHGKPLDLEQLIKELGDVRWYLESMAWVIGVTMQDIEEANIRKLRARFPQGFTNKDANKKADEPGPHNCPDCAKVQMKGKYHCDKHKTTGAVPSV